MRKTAIKRLQLFGVMTAAAFALSACGNTLVFAERTGFNLAIQVNDDPATPVQVNAGLKRSVVGLVPPSKTLKEETNKGSRADGEAVSMFSGFRLEYEEGATGLFQGDLSIRTQFASGMAARYIAGRKDAKQVVAKIVKVRSSSFSKSKSTDRIRVWLKEKPGNLQLLNEWVAEYAPGVGILQIRFGAPYELERKAAISDLNIP